MMIVQNFFEFIDVKVNLSDDLMNEIDFWNKACRTVLGPALILVVSNIWYGILRKKKIVAFAFFGSPISFELQMTALAELWFLSWLAVFYLRQMIVNISCAVFLVESYLC